MDRAWIVDGRGIAKKVKCAGLPASYQINDCGANRQCPSCHHVIDNSDVCVEWPGLPAGVKFDPSDVELLEHLAAKCGVGAAKSHALIDEFIPTLEGDEGICYTHPENLPGAKKDGTSVHFFYRIINAYSSGQRKRRRIQGQENIISAHARWHKTGLTKPVIDNGIQKGFKKIMVLYASSSKRGSKPSRCPWVMHQFHLGAHKDETDGELVVSKIFYQPQKENEKLQTCSETEECDAATGQVIPKTPMTNTPDPPRLENTPPPSDYISSDCFVPSFVQDKEHTKENPHRLYDFLTGNEVEYGACLDGNFDAVDPSGMDSLLCDEIIDSYITLSDLKPNIPSSTQPTIDSSGLHQKHGNAPCHISDLDNLFLDTPPDFQLSDLQFPSQDSVFDMLDRL